MRRRYSALPTLRVLSDCFYHAHNSDFRFSLLQEFMGKKRTTMCLCAILYKQNTKDFNMCTLPPSSHSLQLTSRNLFCSVASGPYIRWVFAVSLGLLPLIGLIVMLIYETDTDPCCDRSEGKAGHVVVVCHQQRRIDLCHTIAALLKFDQTHE